MSQNVNVVNAKTDPRMIQRIMFTLRGVKDATLSVGQSVIDRSKLITKFRKGKLFQNTGRSYMVKPIPKRFNGKQAWKKRGKRANR